MSGNGNQTPQQAPGEGGLGSAIRNPVGSQAKSVYVRRRLAVLGILVAIIIAIVLIIVLPGRSARPDADASGAQKVDVPSDITAQEQAKQESAMKEGEPRECAQARVMVTSLVNHDSYDPGELPELSLSVENTSETECVIDLGTAAMSFEISSGDDIVWRSSDCQTDQTKRPIILEPGKPLETEPIVWDRTRSDPETCDITRDDAFGEGSTYHLRTAVVGTTSKASAQFLLY